jgi:putative ABC transport system permease protein
MRPEHWLFTIPLRLRSLFRWAKADQELDDELRDHLERGTEEYVAKGIAPEEARRRARLDLGGIEQTKEKCRDARRVNWIQDLIQDLRFGLRMLRKSPGFTTVAVLTLALGIGANTAIFGLVDSAFLRGLPFREPERLVHIWTIEDDGDVHTPTPAQYQAVLDNAKCFEQVAASGWAHYFYGADGSLSENVSGFLATANWFSTLGVQPLLGRNFREEEQRPGQDAVTILSYDFWQTRFHADPRIIGQQIVLNADYCYWCAADNELFKIRSQSLCPSAPELLCKPGKRPSRKDESPNRRAPEARRDTRPGAFGNRSPCGPV